MPDYRKILAVNLTNIGDVLLTTGAVALLKKSYPQTKIAMMVRPNAREIVEHNPVVDEVILADYQSRKGSWRRISRLIWTLKKKHFDIAFLFDWKLRSALIVYFAGIPIRVGPQVGDGQNWLSRLYTHTILVPPNLYQAKQLETLQTIVRGFTRISGIEKPVMATIQASNFEKAANLLATLPPSSVRIALCVKGSFGLKNWPLEYFAGLIDSLAVRYPASFFIIGASDDRDYADQVINIVNTPVANFCGLTSMVDLAALFEQSHLLITVDTGAAHIAATTGIPMVALFGCTSPQQWRPYSERIIVLSRELNCSPCSYPANGCPNKHACLRDITVEEVVTAAEQMLEHVLNQK